MGMEASPGRRLQIAVIRNWKKKTQPYRSMFKKYKLIAGLKFVNKERVLGFWDFRCFI